MLVELPENVVRFLGNLAREIDSQDNRCTASPYFFVVRGEEETVAPRGFGDDVYYCPDLGRSFSKEELLDYLAKKEEESGEKVTFEDFVSQKCEIYGKSTSIREENVFLTFKGFQQHMKLNKHNYRHLDNVHSYLKHSFRNPEMEVLWEAIRAFKDIEVGETKESFSDIERKGI